jgi:hypothetical protein
VRDDDVVLPSSYVNTLVFHNSLEVKAPQSGKPLLHAIYLHKPFSTADTLALDVLE